MGKKKIKAKDAGARKARAKRAGRPTYRHGKNDVRTTSGHFEGMSSAEVRKSIGLDHGKPTAAEFRKASAKKRAAVKQARARTLAKGDKRILAKAKTANARARSSGARKRKK